MSPSSGPTTVRRANLVLGAFVLVALIGGGVAGRPSLKAESASVPEPKSVARPAASDEPQEESKEAATIGFLLLSVITFTGLSLVAFVVIWGHRVRRVVRGSLPSQSARDELWYLRPPKEQPEDAAGPADGPAADETETL